MGAVAKSGTECGTVRHRVWHFVAVAQFGTLWHRVWHNVAAAAGTSFLAAHLPINTSLRQCFCLKQKLFLLEMQCPPNGDRGCGGNNFP